MTEEANQKDELQNTNGYYVGKEWVMDGKTKKDKDWKLYKVFFKPKIDSDKKFSFSCFTPLNAKNTKQLNDLEEGKQYGICYTEKPAVSKDGHDFISKTVVGFYAPRSGNSSNQGSSTPKVDLSNFEEFKGEYLNMVKEAGIEPNAIHMIGTYVNYHLKDQHLALINKCKDSLKKD